MVHLVEKVILVIQVLSIILQVSTILQFTIAGFYYSKIWAMSKPRLFPSKKYDT